MKRRDSVACLLLLSACGPSGAHESASAPASTLAALKARLQSVLRKDQPKATLTVQAAASGQDVRTAQY